MCNKQPFKSVPVFVRSVSVLLLQAEARVVRKLSIISRSIWAVQCCREK